MTNTVSIEVGAGEAQAMLLALQQQKRILSSRRLAAIAENNEELTTIHTDRLEAVKTAISNVEAVIPEAPMD